MVNVTVSMCFSKVSSDFIAAQALFSLAFVHMGERTVYRLCTVSSAVQDVHLHTFTITDTTATL